MKGFLAFGALLAVLLLGLGLWTATPMGGGGLGDEGGPGGTVRDEEQGAGPGVVPQDRDDGVAQDDSEGRVDIRDGRFMPSTVEVPRRSIVTFINRDDVARGIDFEDEQLEDAEIRPGGAHTVEVTEPGRFTFSATGDGGAGGEIVVQEE
jgi:plastocyanin